jgi:hypothetical protein
MASSAEQTDDPLYADDRNFYNVEAWSREGMRIDALLYAGSNLDKARGIFVTTIKNRPGVRLTIRERTRVLDRWPPAAMKSPGQCSAPAEAKLVL